MIRAHPPSPLVSCCSTAPPGRLPASGVRVTVDTASRTAHTTMTSPFPRPCPSADPGRAACCRGYGPTNRVSSYFISFYDVLDRAGTAPEPGWTEPDRVGPACHACAVLGTGNVSSNVVVAGFIALGAVAVIGIVVATILGRRSGRRSLEQRLSALASRLGVDAPAEDHGMGIEPALHHLELVTDRAAEAVAESSSDAIRLRRALDTLPQGVIVCDENGTVVFRNARAVGLMGGRHGDALAAEAVVDLLADAWKQGSAHKTLDLYG